MHIKRTLAKKLKKIKIKAETLAAAAAEAANDSEKKIIYGKAILQSICYNCKRKLASM